MSRFSTRTFAVFAVVVLASCFGDATGPGRRQLARVALAPVFDTRAMQIVSVDRVRIRFTRASDNSIALDTTVAFPAGTDTLDLGLQVPIQGTTEQFNVTLLLIDDPAGDTVFVAGPTPVTATAGTSGAPVVTPQFVYVGTGANAAGVRFVQAPAAVFFQDTAVFTAEAFDSAGAAIAGAPLIFSSSDSTRARVPDPAIGRVVGGTVRGSVNIRAELPQTSLSAPPLGATQALAVQPLAVVLSVTGGAGQTGQVGQALALPVTVQVKAADSLGVQGVVVTFAVVSGGGTLSQTTDTTDANGNASIGWTLGATLGTQQVSATVAGLSAGTATVSATALVGAPAKLAFTVQPSAAPASVAITPAVQVAVQDSFGNVVTTFTGNVSVALGANPGNAALLGTTTVAAAAGVATFPTLALDSIGTGYTLVATSAGLAPDTSAAFDVAGGVAARLLIVQEPTPVSAATPISPAVTVEVVDAFGNLVTNATNTVSVAILNNPGSATLGGTAAAAASGGVATFGTLTLDKTGTGYTLLVTATGLTPDTSVAFDVTAGTATLLSFSTQPPSSAIQQTPFVTAVTAFDGGGNVATGFSGAVSIGIGTNPAGGALSGTLTVNAVNGVATFSGLSIDNIGTGYTLVANAAGLSGSASNSFDVVAPVNVVAWVNTAGGNWSVGANWSTGTVPTATDTVFIRQSGTYTVNLDVSATVARLDVGAPSGTQTLAIAGNTLTLAGDGAFTANTALDVSGGTITGSGTLDLFGAMTWTGGSLSGGGGTIRVNTGGTLDISGSATRTLNAFTVELGGTGTWSGLGTINSGSVGTLRVLPGGALDISGDSPFNYNQGGGSSVLDNQGIVTRSTSTNLMLVGAQYTGNGQTIVSSGTLQLAGGGNEQGPFSVATGAFLSFNGGTHALSAGGSVSGAGTVEIAAGTVNSSAAWGVTGTTIVSGGTFNYNGASGATAALDVQSGTLGGSGLLQVTGAMSWTGGSLSGGNGTTQANGTLDIGGATARTLSAYTLEVGGTGTWSATHTINSGNSGTLRVLGAGSLDIQADPSFLYNQGGGSSVFDNQGTVTRSTSTGTVQVTASYQGTGATNVTAGTLQLGGGGTEAGAFTVTSGVLDFSGGTHTMAATSSVGGAGIVSVSGGTVAMAGGWAVTGQTIVNGGTFGYNGASGTTGVLDFSGGTMNGSGLLAVSGALSWGGGSFSGGNGTTQADGTLDIAGTAARSINAHTLALAGTGTWSGTQTISSGSGGTLQVLLGGTLDIQADPSFLYNQGGGTSVFDNQGTVTRSTSTATARITALYQGPGATIVNTGTLQLAGGGTDDGSFNVATGALLDFNGGTHTLTSASVVGGAGNVSVSGGSVGAAGSWSLSGTTIVNGGTFGYNGAGGGGTAGFDLTSGTVNGSGLFVVSGALTWSGGGFSGTGGTTRANGTFNATGTASLTLNNHTLEVGGTGTWTGSNAVGTGGGAILRVLGTGSLDLQGDPTFSYNLGGGTPLFDVQGTLTRSTSASLATIAIPLTAANTVSVTSGQLGLNGGGTLGGTWNVTGSGSLQLNSGTFTMQNGLDMTNATAVNLFGATVNGLAAGDTARIANLNLATGNFGPGIGGVVVLSGTASGWSSSATLNGGGKTLVPPGVSFLVSGTATRSINSGHLLENSGTTTINCSCQISSGGSAGIRNNSIGTMTLSGPVSYLYNQGGGQSFLQNSGTLVRSGAGTATVSASLQNSGKLNVTSGVLDLTGGGNVGDTVTLSDTLKFSTGTYTLTNQMAIVSPLATGIAQLNGGTILQSAATDSATIERLEMTSGTMGQIGTVSVPSMLLWDGGANLTGAGGKTRTLPTATFDITGAAGRTLNNHILENGTDAATWSGTATISSGSNAVFRNIVGGSILLDGDPSFLYNQGGGQSRFENQGTILRQTSTGTVTISAFYADSAGLSVDAGAVSLTGGAALGGSKSVNTGAVLDLGGGTATWANGITVTGTGVVQLSAGTMTLDTAATVTLTNFDENGGTVTHEGLLIITGQWNWNGGNLTSNTVGAGGTTRLQSGGAMDIAGTATRTFSGTHLLDIFGAAQWTGTNFINTGQGATFQVESGGTLTVSANNPTISFNQGPPAAAFVNNGAIVRSTGPAGWVVNAPVSGTGTWSVTGGDLDLQGGGTGGTFSGAVGVSSGASMTFNAGTWTFNASAPITGAGTMQVNTATVNANSPINIGTLNIAGSGTLVAGAQPILVSGNFSTSASGRLSMTNTADSLLVAGSASFGGGSSIISAGRIEVGGDFLQPSGTAAFAASGTNRVVLNGAGTQNISFAAPTQSHFNRLELPASATRNIVLQSDAVVNDSMIVLGGGTKTTVVGAGTSQRLTVNGILRVTQQTTSPLVAPPILELAQYPSVDSIFIAGSGINPDTTVFLPGNNTFPSGRPMHYKSVRLANNAVMNFNSSGSFADSLLGDLVIDGTSTFNLQGSTFGVVVTGKLRTINSGVLRMQQSFTQMTVNDSAIFGGGSTAGQLTAGTLTLRGNFTQTGTNSYQPTVGHTTEFNGTGIQTISFASPGTGAANSRFGILALQRAVGGLSQTVKVNLLSNVQAGILRDTSGGANDSLLGTGSVVLNLDSLQVTNTVFNNLPVVLGPNNSFISASSLIFENMDPTTTFLTINRNGASTSSIFGLSFNTTPTTGRYLHIDQGAIGVGYTLTVSSGVPTLASAMTGLYTLTSAGTLPTLVWNGTTNP